MSELMDPPLFYLVSSFLFLRITFPGSVRACSCYVTPKRPRDLSDLFGSFIFKISLSLLCFLRASRINKELLAPPEDTFSYHDP